MTNAAAFDRGGGATTGGTAAGIADPHSPQNRA
jgi:hypothetical protein